MAGNITPIYSKVGDIQGSVILTLAAGDYTGANSNNAIVFQSDSTNGGYLQRLRFKALGTNVSTVARIYINEGYPALANNASLPGQPTATVNNGAGSGALNQGSYYAVVQAIDGYGIPTNFSPESSVATVTSNTANIVYSWNGSSGAQYYRLFVGPSANGEVIYFTTSGNTTTYTVSNVSPNLVTNLPAQGQPKDFIGVNYFYGEVSLPATTAVNNAATVDVDYPMNIALPPSYHVLVGLGLSVAAGWTVTSIAGKY
jgi:hypothetical protein